MFIIYKYFSNLIYTHFVYAYSSYTLCSALRQNFGREKKSFLYNHLKRHMYKHHAVRTIIITQQMSLSARANETIMEASETVIGASERGIAVGRENSRIEPFRARCYSPLARSYYCLARSYYCLVHSYADCVGNIFFSSFKAALKIAHEFADDSSIPLRC